MSNALAIAAVTSTIQGLLTRSLTADLPAGVVTEMNLGNARVTTATLDRARPSNANFNQLNLCLFQILPSAALRNADLGGPRPPVALELHYILSAYSGTDDDRPAQVLLGQALRILHDRAVLGQADLRAALKGNDLADQIDAVRLSPRPISLEDLARLWSMAQTQARLSAGYTASVVLIDSAAPRRTPLPVLRRGLAVAPTPLVGPTLLDLVVPQARPFALLGDPIELVGANLRAAEVRARLTHPRLPAPIDLTPAAGSTDARLRVTLPTDPTRLPAGVYGVSVVLRDAPDLERTTGALALPVAPEPTAIKATRNGAAVTLTVDVRPAVLASQPVSLIVGDRELVAPARAVPGPAVSQLAFTAAGLAAGPALLRLRVDGVDSDLLDRADTPPSQFDPTRRVTIP